MTKQQKKHSSSSQAEKILTLAGLGLVIVGGVSSLFYTSVNQRFVHDILLDSIYYLNYLVLLAGGLAAGYITTKGDKWTRLFSSVSYSFLAMLLYVGYEAIRVLLQNSLWPPTYPLGSYAFLGGPLAVLIVTTIIAACLQYRKQPGLSKIAQWIFVVIFGAYQIYMLSYIVEALVKSVNIDFSYMPLWLVVINYLTYPLFVAIIAFVSLLRIKDRFQRVFYASFIATFSSILTTILWNFRIDPSINSLGVFQGFTTSIALLATALVILKVRAASRKR